jgi:hypothetical protein
MAINTKELFEGKKRLNAFIEEHPELKELQAEIDTMFSSAGTSQNRMALLERKIKDMINQLTAAVTELEKKLKNI